jgi:hypothetical protein
MSGTFNPDAELVEAERQAAALLAGLPDESADRLRPFVAGCRALHVARIRHYAAACITEASGWAELYSLAEAGAVAELDTLEKLWAEEDEPGRWQETEVALELFRTACGLRFPTDNEGEEWREK